MSLYSILLRTLACGISPRNKYELYTLPCSQEYVKTYKELEKSN